MAIALWGNSQTLTFNLKNFFRKSFGRKPLYRFSVHFQCLSLGFNLKQETSHIIGNFVWGFWFQPVFTFFVLKSGLMICNCLSINTQWAYQRKSWRYKVSMASFCTEGLVVSSAASEDGFPRKPHGRETASERPVWWEVGNVQHLLVLQKINQNRFQIVGFLSWGMEDAPRRQLPLQQ